MGTVYKGVFTVVNASPYDMSDVEVTHHCSKYKSSAAAPTLVPGQATYAHLTTESDNSDTWDVTFTTSKDGKTTRDGKQCNAPNKADTAIMIVLYADSYTILTNDYPGGPCFNNHY